MRGISRPKSLARRTGTWHGERMQASELDEARRRVVWEERYAPGDPTRLSWHQPVPTVSLELIEALGIPRDAAILDAGGGASTLVDALAERGFGDITVLDLSAAALRVARRRAGREAAHWIEADLLSWSPDRRYDLWHDRAVFHFLVDEADRERYRRVLRRALRDGGHAIVACFAPDGPEECSGLPVQRYDTAALLAALGEGFTGVGHRRELHRTPRGDTQPFTWVAARYTAERDSSGL